MDLMRVTQGANRYTLSLTRHGVMVTHWRASTIGGWYPRQRATCPWWWVR